MRRGFVYCILLTLLVIVLLGVSLLVGAVDIPAQTVVDILLGKDSGKPSWNYIVLQSRLPQALTAMLCGSSLAISGLMLQTAFRNPLAGPSVFGINSGASLGVALVMLYLGGSITAGSFSFTGFFAVLAAAFIGAMAVMLVIFLFSTVVKDNVMLLIIGIMIGYITSSAISLLNFFATEEGVQSYMVWGLGNFGGVSMKQMPEFAMVNTQMLRNNLLLVTGLLTAISTAFCGPVSFIGLAVPHIARMILNTDNHKSLMPATILTGAAVAMLCNIITVLPGDAGIIPLNAVTPIIGAPIIIYVIAQQRRASSSDSI